MLIGIFADIHANREALEACLFHARLQGVDQYVFLGDLIGYGADPEWALDTIMRYHETGASIVLGNHDESVLKESDKTMYEDARQAVEWTRPRINTTQVKFLADLPLRVEKSDTLFVHANAWEPGGWEYITSVTEARRSLASTHCRFTFCGHLHMPALYHQGMTGRVVPFTPVAGVGIPLGAHRRWLAVLGSVGQPRDGNPAACYAILDSERNLLTYFRVPYDVESAARKIREAGLPEWLSVRLEKGV
jgi:diadenosine tetraphosphatase ApaH/serine/threonine PP2A family protein phosphatase